MIPENGTANQIDKSLSDWREKEKLALELLGIVGELRFDRGVELTLFRRDIYDSRPSEVLNDHLFAKNYAKQPINVETSLQLARSIAKLEGLAAAKIDIGALATEWLAREDQSQDVETFIGNKLGGTQLSGGNGIEPKDVILYGFGRIGRLAARRIILTTGKGEQLRLKAIVVRPKLDDRELELKKRASLLRKDSVHGKFRGTVSADVKNEELVVNGNRIKMIFAKSPEDIDYTTYGINNALVIDNTGAWRDKEALGIHLRPGVSQVLFTAPAKGIPNIVHGINHEVLDFEKDKIFCAASCTTNGISPVIKVINDAIGIEQGHIESVHAYTSAQNLLDNFHKKPRRGRAAAVNMVITSTGAAKAVGLVLPEIAGLLTGNAVRVPTPNVSLAILSLRLKKETTKEGVNELLKQASLFGDLVEQIKYSTSNDFVSSDAVGTTHPSVFDAPSTIVSEDGKTATLYVWYDNEYGYTCQVVRLAKYAAKVRRPKIH